MDMNKEEKSLLVIIAPVLIILALIIFLIFSKTNLKANIISRKVEKELNKKYNTGITLTYKDKRKDLCLTFFDSCLTQEGEVTTYQFLGSDNSNNQFYVYYTAYGKEFVIREDYYNLNDIEKIKSIISEYYSKYDIYYNPMNFSFDKKYNTFYIRIYDEKYDPTIFDELLSRCSKNGIYFIVDFTTDLETYNIVVSNNELEFIGGIFFEYNNYLTKNLNYKMVKKEYNDFSSSIKGDENTKYFIYVRKAIEKNEYSIFEKEADE